MLTRIIETGQIEMTLRTVPPAKTANVTYGGSHSDFRAEIDALGDGYILLTALSEAYGDEVFAHKNHEMAWSFKHESSVGDTTYYRMTCHRLIDLCDREYECDPDEFPDMAAERDMLSEFTADDVEVARTCDTVFYRDSSGGTWMESLSRGRGYVSLDRAYRMVLDGSDVMVSASASPAWQVIASIKAMMDDYGTVCGDSVDSVESVEVEALRRLDLDSILSSMVVYRD